MGVLREDEDVVRLNGFTGLRNTVTSESFAPGDLEAALNVDITDANRVRRRKGYGTALSAGNYHSVWSNGTTALVVSGSVLYQILPDYSLRSVRAGLSTGRRMSYAHLGDRVFYSNGADSGVFQAGTSRTWGIAAPLTQPSVAAVGGSLPPGRYQYALTYRRGDGQESGTGPAGFIELSVIGGLSFTNIPVSPDPGVVSKLLYISPANGDALYLIHELAAGATAAIYTNERTGERPLTTQHLSPPPAGSAIAVFAGRTLVASGDRLYPSEPFAPELFDLRKAIALPGAITLVAPVSDGVYLGTGYEIGWAGGKDPAKWEYVIRADYGAIPGTLAYIAAEDVGEQSGLAAMFATAQGLCAGFDGGSFVNLTQERFNYPVTSAGAGVVRNQGGAVQYVVTLQGDPGDANTAF